MTTPEPENMDQLGETADDIDSLIAAMSLPMPAQFHLDQLKSALPKLRDRLRAIYVVETGEDPWGHAVNCKKAPD